MEDAKFHEICEITDKALSEAMPDDAEVSDLIAVFLALVTENFIAQSDDRDQFVQMVSAFLSKFAINAKKMLDDGTFQRRLDEHKAQQRLH